MKNLFRAAAVCSLLISGAAALTAAPMEPVIISKTTVYNPTIAVSGPESYPDLARELRNFLNICGWFDLTSGSRPNYQLDARIEGGRLRLELTQGGAPVGVWSVATTGIAPREIAKSAVDAIIENTFKDLKVRGFCRSKIAFCAETRPGIRNIFTCDIDGGNIEQITNYRTMCVEPAWRPDGKSICYSKYGKTTIDIAETTVAKPRRSRIISAYRGINAGAAISPDCSKMAMILSPDHKVDLYVLDLASRRLTRLTRGIAVEASPCWSPDGRRIAYVSDEIGAPRIFTISADGRDRQLVPTIGVDAVTPDWSDDGKIVYATRLGGSYTLAVYDPATGKNTRGLEKPGTWESPAWAADNRQVVCKRSDGPKGALYVVDTLTGNVRLLISTPHPLSMPVWSPCEKAR